MNREDIAVVALRLFLLLMIFQLIAGIPGGLQSAQELGDPLSRAVFAAYVVLSLVLYAFLWIFALFVARKLLPVMREPRSNIPVDSSIALSLGLTLIGIWFLASGLIDLSYWLTLLLKFQQAGEQPFPWAPVDRANFVATLVQIALSIWLILGNAGIRRLIFKFRYGEQPTGPE